MKNGQMLLKHLSWIGKIVKIYERSGKKLEMSGKIFGKKCMEKNPGGQKFWQRGGGEIS